MGIVTLLAVPVSAQESKPTVEVRLEYLMTLEVPMDLPQLLISSLISVHMLY